MRTITIQANDAGQRLDKFLLKLLPDMPKSLLYKYIRKKRIKYNQARCKGMELLAEGDTLQLYIDDAFFQKTASHDFHGAAGSLQIAYEDDRILVVYKPVGMFAHSGNDPKAVSLIDEVQKYLYDQQVYDPAQEQSFAPALCNRIDRNTEGLVIAAKDAAALRDMNAAIRDRCVDKSYLAVTAAPLPKQQDTCTAWLKKDSKTNMVQVADRRPDASWQQIRTAYQVLAQNGSKQLVHIRLLTGRTHQIRAHLAHLHAPLLGDPKYGRRQADAPKYQCLCAFRLKFAPPAESSLHTLHGTEVFAPLPAFVCRYFPDITAADIRKRVS